MKQVDTVTLGNGTQVPLLEFIEWNYQKQTHALKTPEAKLRSEESKKQMSDSHAGKTCNDITLQRMREAKKKQLHTPIGIFNFRAEAALAYNVTGVTIFNWMKKSPTEFYYIK